MVREVDVIGIDRARDGDGQRLSVTIEELDGISVRERGGRVRLVEPWRLVGIVRPRAIRRSPVEEVLRVHKVAVGGDVAFERRLQIVLVVDFSSLLELKRRGERIDELVGGFGRVAGEDQPPAALDGEALDVRDRDRLQRQRRALLDDDRARAKRPRTLRARDDRAVRDDKAVLERVRGAQLQCARARLQERAGIGGLDERNLYGEIRALGDIHFDEARKGNARCVADDRVRPREDIEVEARVVDERPEARLGILDIERRVLHRHRAREVLGRPVRVLGDLQGRVVEREKRHVAPPVADAAHVHRLQNERRVGDGDGEVCREDAALTATNGVLAAIRET